MADWQKNLGRHQVGNLVHPTVHQKMILVVTLALERGVPVGEQVDNFSTRSVSVAW